MKKFKFLSKIKNKDRSGAFSIFMLIVLFISFALTIASIFPMQVQAAWYDNSYSYRKKLPISNSSGSTQTDFQVQITVDTASLISAGKMQSNCSDVRITDASGKILPYWIEPTTCNTVSTLIWTKVPTIGTSGACVYVYYGNPVASSAANTSTTFIRDMTGAAVNWPLDDTTSTQSYSRVINPYLASGRNIVLNGTFDTDTIWTKGTGWTIASGVATAAAATGNLSQASLPIQTGRSYAVTYTVANRTAGSFQINLSGGIGPVRNGNGTFTDNLTATTTTATLTFSVSNLSADIDNVSLVELNIPATPNIAATQLLADGDMEAAGTSSYSSANAAVLSKQTTNPHGGSQVIRVARNGQAFPAARQIILTVGVAYRIYGFFRGDGTSSPRMDVTVTTATGSTSTNWQQFDISFTATQTSVLLEAVSAVDGSYVEFDDVTVLQDTGMRLGEVIQDGNMETSDTSAWIAGGSATLTKDTSAPHGGVRNLRVARNGSNNPRAQQTNVLVVGKKYRVTGYVKGDGTAIPTITDGTTTFATGTNSTSWQLIDGTATAASTIIQLQATTSTGTTFAEFDDISIQEISPLVGIPTNGVTLGATASGHLTNAYSFDGTNDLGNIYSPELNSVLNQSEGSLVAWAKVSGSGIWTDGTTHYIAFLQADSSNRLILLKSSTNNTISFNYTSGGTTSQVTSTSIGGSTSWFQLVITWSKADDQVKAFINGAQVGSTQTGLGTWVGNLTSTSVTLGANSSSGTNPWSGMINDVRLYSRVL